MRKIVFSYLLIGIFITGISNVHAQGDNQTASLVKDGATIQVLAEGFQFTEGITSDQFGSVFFSDIPESKIYKIGPEGNRTVWLENSQSANGLQFLECGELFACQGAEGGALISIYPANKFKVIVREYEGKSFNSLNDLWVTPGGGIYITDPRYGQSKELNQDGEHVYFVKPDRKTVIRVTDDLVKPNGVIGTPDGKKLYIADPGDKKTYSYNIKKDGSLSGKKLFANEGSDGMTIDEHGNIYLTTEHVKVYNPEGELIETIEIPQRPTNVCFGGKEKDILYITARKAVYYIDMKVKGVGSN